MIGFGGFHPLYENGEVIVVSRVGYIKFRCVENYVLGLKQKRTDIQTIQGIMAEHDVIWLPLLSKIAFILRLGQYALEQAYRGGK